MTGEVIGTVSAKANETKSFSRHLVHHGGCRQVDPST